LPELPEVETLCRQLDGILPGQEIRGVRVVDARLGPLAGLGGYRIFKVTRQGKGLCLKLENGPTVFLHLRMTGRLLWQKGAAPIPSHTRLIISFSSGKLLLIDPRRFATVRVGSDPVLSAPLANPLDGLPARRLKEMAEERRLPVKSFLMDQRFIAGIGNIYACEILHGAKIDPGRPAGSLTIAEWRRVEKASALVLPRAVACRGTTVSDWRDLFGASGSNQEHLEVYAREGDICRRCGGRIERRVMGGRGTWSCPSCQR